MSCVSTASDPPASASVIPSITSPATAAAAATSPEITALAARHISGSPSCSSFCLKSGINAAVSAPSPSSRRNRLGT